MGIRAGQSSYGGRRASVSALALLALLAHAFVVTTLHAHPRTLALGDSYHSGTQVREDRPAEGSGLAARHAQCLLCSLQRDFVTDLDALPPAPSAPARPLARPRAREATAHARESYLTPGGRAPPRTQNS